MFAGMADEDTERTNRPSIFNLYATEDEGSLIVRWPGDQRSIPDEFAEAADRLAGTFRGEPQDDLLLHPFLYLYRHAIETAMKELILDVAALRRLRGEEGPEVEHDAIVNRHRFKVRHHLAELLDELNAQLAAAEIEELPDDAHSTIKLIIDADPMGNSFRFPAEYVDTDYVDFPRLAAVLAHTFSMIRAGSDLVESHHLGHIERFEWVEEHGDYGE